MCGRVKQLCLHDASVCVCVCVSDAELVLE